jgi:gentisate 1,2-dioxygenase
MTIAIPSALDNSGLVGLLEEHNVQPLWLRFHSIASREPQPMDNAMHWPWQTMLPLIDRTVREVPMEHAERRALVMANPELGGRLITTGSMTGALQIIEPGESADPHRHTAAAIRFILESEGAVTSVNGQGCEMRPGDLILTPAWTWHGHVNNTGHRAVWFDGLDVPLVRFDVDAFFYEPGKDRAPPNALAASGDGNGWNEAGMMDSLTAASPAYSPKFRYSWQAAMRAIQSMSASPDGSKLMRYVNPQSGGAVMPTMDCYLLHLDKSKETRPRRSTSSSVCVVAEGEGHSIVGDRKISWKKNDVFTVPHWRWASHVAASASACIFQMTDRELYARLDLLREEQQ